MKYILPLLFSLFLSLNSNSQAILKRAGSSNTIADERFMAVRNLFLPRYEDTTAANLDLGIDSCGSKIYTYADNATWTRKCSPKRWVEDLDVDNIMSLGWLLSGNSGTNPATDFIGTTDNQDLVFRINDVPRATLNTLGGFVMDGNGSQIEINNTSGDTYLKFGDQSSRYSQIHFSNLGLFRVEYNDLIAAVTKYPFTQTTNGRITLGTDPSIVTSGLAVDPNVAALGDLIPNVPYLSGNGNVSGLNIGANNGATTGGIVRMISKNSGGIRSILEYTDNTALTTSDLILQKAGGNVGIGVPLPTTALHIVGDLRLVNGSQALGSFLKSDANGVATWSALSGADISDFSTKVTKNGDTDGADLTLGTNDKNSVNIKTNNIVAVTVTSGRDVGVRKSDPQATLHLYGSGSNGSNSHIFFGDSFGNTTTPYVSIGENGASDNDQLDIYAQKGAGISTGTYGSTHKLWVTQAGAVCVNTETPVSSMALTVSGNADISGNLTAGNIISFSGVLDFPNTTAGTSSELTIAVAGAAVGDAIAPGIPTSNANSMYEYRVSAANVVTVKFNNYSLGSINPVSSTFKGFIFK